MPIQPAGAVGVKGTVEVLDHYQLGLKDLEQFSHIILLYHFHRVQEYALEVVPFMDSESHGIFATRAPKRPNPIGLSVVKLERIENNILHVENIDVLDGTPLLDIKPYVPAFDVPNGKIRTGWLERVQHHVTRQRSDKRFA